MTEQDAYFVTEAGGEPQSPARFERVADVAPVGVAPGLTFKPVLGEAVLVAHVTFDPHTEAPIHTHVEEQIVLVLSGSLEFTAGEETRIMRPGDVAVIPPWVPHGARTHDDPCLEVDIFSPPRRQLLDLLRPAEPDSAAGS